MRYEGRQQKSQSFALGKENKENNDISNLHPFKLKRELLCPKIQKKVSEDTGISTTTKESLSA